MKRIMTIIVGALVSASLFTECKKDTNTPQPAYNSSGKTLVSTVSSAGTNSPNADISNSALLKYNITITQPALTELLQWNSGYMMVGQIFFNAGTEVGNSMQMAHYSSALDRVVTLISPTANDNVTFLGNLYPLNGRYFGPVSGFVMEGINPPSPTSQPNRALVLNGNLIRNGQRISVQILLNQAVEVKANVQTPVFYMFGDQSGTMLHYTASLSLNMNKVLAGINAASLSNAAIINNTITIADNSNQNLYQLIVNNLSSGLQVQIDQDGHVPVVTAAIAPAANR